MFYLEYLSVLSRFNHIIFISQAMSCLRGAKQMGSDSVFLKPLTVWALRVTYGEVRSSFGVKNVIFFLCSDVFCVCLCDVWRGFYDVLTLIRANGRKL